MMERRLLLGIYFVLGVFIIFLLKLWYLQIIKGAEYKKIAEQNRLRTIDIPAPRGIIYDRNNKPLVKNIPSFDISAVKEDLPTDPVTLETLGKLLDLTPATIQGRLKKKPEYLFEPVKLKQNVSFKQAAQVEARAIDFPGLQVDVVVSREYIYGESNSHMMGYLGRLTLEQMRNPQYWDVPRMAFIGQFGVEKIYDNLLRGVAGKKIIEIDAIGRVTRVVSVQQPIKGDEISLTIDIDLQMEAEKALKGKVGAVVALDPQSGEVLVLASSPTYNPNLFSRGIEHKAWRKLISDPKKPLLNRTIQSQYPPGSIFKIITAIAALEEGIITESTSVTCKGSIYLGRVFRCWQKKGHGRVNLNRAIVESCDVYFYEIGRRLGIDKIADYASAFWLGKSTGIELDGERTGIVPSTSWKLQNIKQQWFPGETLITAIGQGYLATTPIQIARLMAAVINGGYIYKSHILKSSEHNDNQEGMVNLKNETVELIRKALVGVVSDKRGTGWRARSREVTIGGKTGTVQVVGSEKSSDDDPYEHRDHAWFAAFAPQDNPRIVVSVLVEHGGHGSKAAAPIAKRVIEKFIKKQKLKNQIAH
jgi:penicillin-binding protein 2